MDGVPGFYGKLPSHGDFVGRRLPPSVRHCFDAWLQGALVCSKAALGPAWLPTWGSSPLWRFVVGAGVCGEQAWAGVMMPSADRVGRPFPLLLAAAIDGTPALGDCLTLHDGWFARLEALALGALEADFSLEGFDAALRVSGATAGCIAPAGAETPRAASATVVPLADAALADAGCAGGSAWWTHGSPAVAPCLVLCEGLPAPASFVALLDGRWRERGWLG